MSEIVDCIAWIVRKVAWSFWVFLKFITLRFLDLLGLILNIAACCTIVRLPHTINDLKECDSFFSWRLLGLFQLMIFLLDIPIFLMWLFVMITVVRVVPCFKELKEKYKGFDRSPFTYSGWKLREIIVKQFFKSWIDIFLLPVSLPVLLSWRCVIFVRKLKNATDSSKRRKVCFKEFLHWLLDILLIPPFIIAGFSWRLPFLVRKVRKFLSNESPWNDIRFLGIKQVFFLLLDIPCLILLFVTCCTWRLPFVVYEIRRIMNKTETYSRRQNKIRKAICLQFLSIFLDIPVIIVSFVLFITLFRLPSLVHGVKKEIKKSNKVLYRTEMRIRGECLRQFGILIIDFFTLLAFVIVVVTLWRIYPLISKLRKYLSNGKAKGNHLETEECSRNSLQNTPNQSVTTTPATARTAVDCTENKPTLDETQGIKMGSVPPTDKEIDISDQTNSHNENIENTVDEGIVGENQSLDDELPSNTEPTEVVNLHSQNDAVMYQSISPSTEKSSKRHIAWKIRKCIWMQFAFLFIDLPAIPLCLFLLVTVLRTKRLISNLLGGEFYMMFAFSVYYNFIHFLVELVFIVIFLLLSIRKPIHLWTVLLEDDAHKSNRLLRFIMQWVPDIASDRETYYCRLKEVLAFNFKEKENTPSTEFLLEEEFRPLLDRLENLLKRLEKYEIEDEFLYHVKCAIFMEKKRPKKLLRTYIAEMNFLERPNVKIHETNIRNLKAEMVEYEQQVNDIYKTLVNYEPPKVSLYENQSGLSLRTREETKKVLIDCLPRDDLLVSLGVLICILPLYRAPNLIKRLFNSWYNRVEILKETLYEYGLDIITFFRILIVLAFIYRAPFMLADIFDCLVEKRSWRAVRKVVKHYPAFIVEDIANILVTLFSWDTPRFLFTVVLFGALMPADLFLTICKSCCQIKAFAFLLTILLYIVFMGFPIVYSFYGAEKIMQMGSTDLNVVVMCVFLVSLFVILLLMIITAIRDKNKKFFVEMPEVDYVRYNWYNIHVILFEILEFFQAIALIFKLSQIPMFGSEILSEASKYLLFSFLPFKNVFWTTVAFFVVWFLLCGAPIIFENILETFQIGTFGKRASWRMGISLFANTLFLTFVENFVSTSACFYKETSACSDPINYAPFVNSTNTTNSSGILFLNQITSSNNTPNTNETCILAEFLEDKSMQCWSSPHRKYAVFTLVALVWYTTTALIFDTQYGDPETSEQDIGFSPIYNTVLNILKALMVISVTVITDNHTVSLICVLVLAVLCILFTLLFKVIFKFYPSNLPRVLIWRLFTFISVCITAVAVLVAYTINDNNSKIPLLIIGIGIGLGLIICICITIKLRIVNKTQKDREDFRTEIQRLEARCLGNNWMLPKWEKKRKIWLRLVKSVSNAQKNDKFLIPQPSDSSPQVTKTTDLPPPHVTPVTYQTFDETIPKMTSEQDVHMEVGGSEEDYTLDLPPPPSFEAVQNAKGLYDLKEVMSVSFSDEVLKLEKNGRNLLIILEKYIDYRAYRYAFFTQRNIWLETSWNCNWTNLLQCLRILNKSIDGNFYKPTTLDLSLARPSIDTDLLSNDPQDDLEPPPPFVPLTREMIETISRDNREKAINDVSKINENFKVIFERILPDIAVIKSWEFSEVTSSFELLLRRPVVGTITEIESSGHKLAIGACVKLGKKLSGNIYESRIRFDKKCQPAGSKGPVTAILEEVELITKNKKLYVQVNGKQKIPLKTLVDSTKTIRWN